MNRFFATVALALPLFIGFVNLSAQSFSWQNFTNKDQITSLEYYADYLWATTTGGVVRINLSSGEIKSYINTDGLGSIRTSFSTYTGDGVTYFGSTDGFLSWLDIEKEDFSVALLKDREGEKLKLYSADTTDGFLWIGCNIGVIKFDRFRHDGEVKETYRTLGLFSAEMPVYSTLVFDGLIFAAGAEGLAYADFSNPFLLDPTEWENIASGDSGLTADTVLIIEAYNNTVYVGTNEGLFVLEDDHHLSPVAALPDGKILDLKSSLGGLYVVVDDGVKRLLYLVDQFSVTGIEIDGLPDGELNSVTVFHQLIVGTSESGIFFQDGEEYLHFEVPGPASNDLIGGGITSDRVLYTVSSLYDYSKLADSTWETFNISTARNNSALLDRDDNLWIGTFGQGAFRISSTGNVQNFDNSNSAFSGVEEDVTYVVVKDIDQDQSGRIWFASYRGYPTRPLVMFDPAESLWTYFDDNDHFISDRAQAVAGGDGFVATGFENKGVALIRYGTDPFDHLDDRLDYYDRKYFLPSDNVTAMVVDRDNVLWVGTNLGLAYFDLDIDFFFPVALPDGVSSGITALAVDARNNLWVGTSHGLAFISDGGTEVWAFNTENSNLIGDEIRNLVFDPETGKLLIFTNGGLSILDYNLFNTSTGSSVYAYPNPFEIVAGTESLLRFNIDQRGNIKLFTIAGDLVRETDVNCGWDGRNNSGELVASGVYIYHLVAEDGSEYTGKVFVLRR